MVAIKSNYSTISHKCTTIFILKKNRITLHQTKINLLKKKILFIINPISGGLNKTLFPSLIGKYLNLNIFDVQIIYSEYHGHAKQLAMQGLSQYFEIVVAVGGDGTINEVASVLESSGKIMGIIPCGSGNGLARTLKIPLSSISAIKRLNQLNTVKIDVGVINNKKFFNMAGMGFDAHISALFADSEKRGFSGYFKSTLKEIRKYKPQDYQIEIDGKVIYENAFMLSIANSSQYGNNAHVSPFATINDGKLDLCIIKPFPIYSFPKLVYRMFSKTSNLSRFVKITQGNQFKIKRLKAGPIHLDGEPLVMDEILDVSIKHLALELVI